VGAITRTSIVLPSPDLQIAFASRLAEVRTLMLVEALEVAVSGADLERIDRELGRFAPKQSLRELASRGVRGEVIFAVPCLLASSPRLLGYYRLLLGYSQKEFFKSDRAAYRRMEDDGLLGPLSSHDLEIMSRALCGAAASLAASVSGIGPRLVQDLQILTLGPQLRGGKNNRIGQGATKRVLWLIKEVAGASIVTAEPSSLRIRNRAGRHVRVEFANDPDVAIIEELKQSERPIVSIEIKGGTDVSNIHNRLGEAEKSHLKARDRGFTKFWTLLNAPVKPADARRASPQTTEFFQLGAITDPASKEHARFVESLRAELGL